MTEKTTSTRLLPKDVLSSLNSLSNDIFGETTASATMTPSATSNSITTIKSITTRPLPTVTKKATAVLVPGDILSSFNSLSNDIFENSGASSTTITTNHEEITKKKCMHAPINHNITNTKSSESLNT